MEVHEVIWLDAFVEKLWRKHRVSIDEFEQVLSGRPRVRRVARGDVAGEDVYAAMGRTAGGRYLIVFMFSKAGAGALVISPRDVKQRSDANMPRGKKERIPKHFRSLEDAGAFWDTHDLADYWEQTEEVPVSFRLKRRRQLLAIEPDLARRLHAAAEARGVNPETIANLWLREMLGKARAPFRRKGASRTAA